MTEFTFRPYRVGDEEAINDGFNRIFHLKRPIEEWRWKFRPDEDACRIMLACDEHGAIVAQYAGTVSPMQVDGRVVRAAQPVDVYCHPGREAAHQQVFVKTVHEFFRAFGSASDISVMYGFPGTRALRLGRLKLGYEHTRPVPFWRRPVEGSRLWFHRYAVRSACSREEMDALWQCARRRYGAGLVRDGAWLERRCLSRPNAAYLYLTVWRGGAIHALAVLDVAGDRVRWLDLVWDGQDVRALRELDQAVSHLARARGATSVEMWLAGDEGAATCLRTAGWQSIPHPQGLHVTVRSFDPAIDPEDVVAGIYYMMADSDLC